MDAGALTHLLGGLGLFLLALGMMTDGLKLAAGNRLKTVLEWGTTPAWRGLVSGILITVLVQASGAVTVSAIGFVNAGLMGLGQSLAVIFGTNIGTTATGWLVAAVGFKFDITALALPMVGLGMLFKLVAGGQPRGGLGWALAGFGLFFMGIGLLTEGFAGLSQGASFGFVGDYGFVGILISVGVGIVVTVLAQSSSAAVALVLTAAQGGVVMLPSAAAMVIGANIGTTSTALFATIGATPNAKRVAVAHALFNGITGLVALLLLFVTMVTLPLDDLNGFMAPAAFLALFHTAFNLMGVALIWPLRERMARFLMTLFRRADENLARPAYLDPNVARVPALGGVAILREVARIADLTREGVVSSMQDGPHAAAALSTRHDAVERLVVEVGSFAGKVQQGIVRAEHSQALSHALRVCQYYAEAMEMAQRVRGMSDRLAPGAALTDLAQPSRFVEDWLGVINASVPAGPTADFTPPAEEWVDDVEAQYHAIRQRLIDASMQGGLNAQELILSLEGLGEMNRLMKRMAKAARHYRKAAKDFAAPADKDDEGENAE